ncbi:MAG: hypothetical protein IPL36_01880 [Nigerium sp.]|nr:hypothetical protein [Nigerium sp.]
MVEVHGYALTDPGPGTRTRLWIEAERVVPSLAGAPVLAEEWLMESDCPLVDTSPWADRPTVATSDPRVVLAGDLVRCDLPVALMERAATTGWQAANQLLTGWGRRGHTLWSPPDERPPGPNVDPAEILPPADAWYPDALIASCGAHPTLGPPGTSEGWPMIIEPRSADADS